MAPGVSTKLPIGQTEISDFPRWGLVEQWPTIPARPTLMLGGDVSTPYELTLDDLATLPRYEQTSDFHCVTTWTRRGLTWGGYRLRDFYEQIFLPRTIPDRGVKHLVFLCLDHVWTGLPLEDALAEDVMLADTLDGEPLSVEHGSPLRLVAPAHYGYKSAKHLSAIQVVRGSPGARHLGEHPRGRVAFEERGQGRPGPEFRGTYAAALPDMLTYFKQAAARNPRVDIR